MGYWGCIGIMEKHGNYYLIVKHFYIHIYVGVSREYGNIWVYIASWG